MSAYFLYGTLLEEGVFRRQAGCAPPRRLLPGRVCGVRRVGLRGTPYPTLVRGGGGEVAGRLLPRLGPAVLARLRAYEGPGYALVPVRVLTPRGPRWARAWVAAPWRADAGAAWAPPVGRRCAAK